MRQLEDVVVPVAPAGEIPSIVDGDVVANARLHAWLSNCHGLLYSVALIVPSALFVVYLVSLARRSLMKLMYGRSSIMIAYYALLCIVTLLNLVWCILQAWQCSPSKEFSWNLLSLFNTSGMLFLEVSLIAFLLQGNEAGGQEALTRTFVVSGVIVVADILLKVVQSCCYMLSLPISSAALHHLFIRLFPGGRSEAGECILF